MGTLIGVTGIAVGVLLVLCGAFGAYFLMSSMHSSVATSTQISITPTADPYLMTCDQLHQHMLSLAYAINYTSMNSASVAQYSGILQYYTLVYNLRIQANYDAKSMMTPAVTCQYP
jgi:hypothetical protein